MSAKHSFEIPLMPDCVPAELLALSRGTRVEYTTGLRVGHNSGLISAEGLIDLFEERIARRRVGRYSLIEAAALVEAEAGEDFSRMLDDLAIAAVSGELRVHERDRKATYRATAVSSNAAKFLETTASQLNAWLAQKHPLISFRFQDPPPASALGMQLAEATGTPIDLSRLATRQQLITAFGAFTGMDDSWFNNLKDSPALLSARKVKGSGGRGHIAEPLFCPLAVMLWLTSQNRKKGRALGVDKAWEILEKHFPNVHLDNSAADPRPG